MTRRINNNKDNIPGWAKYDNIYDEGKLDTKSVSVIKGTKTTSSIVLINF